MTKSGFPDKHLADATGPASSPNLPPEPPRYAVQAILGDQREAILIHNGEPYRLRVTANNKLILTK